MHPEQHPPLDEVRFSHHVTKSKKLGPNTSGLVGLARFKEVEFDCGHFDWVNNALFKYVLIEIRSCASSDSKLIVRGMTSADYHAESAEPTLRQIDSAGLTHRVIGGGRIRYVPGTKSLTVYGYSMGYPWPNGEYKNELVATMIKQSFPDLKVDWSDEGY